MKINQNRINIQRTGVYYTSAEESMNNRLWYCCHGYGQVADLMVRKLDRRIESGDSVCCVEAVNRFYWKGVGGQPVATWMTKRYRLDEIKDNNKYLSDVYRLESSKFDKQAHKCLLGFSQGGTTMWRWIHGDQPDFDVFINYAGWIPEDVDLSTLQSYLNDKKLIFVYGLQDQYLTEDRIAAMKEVIEKSGLDIKIISYDGDHSIDRDVLDLIANDLF